MLIVKLTQDPPSVVDVTTSLIGSTCTSVFTGSTADSLISVIVQLGSTYTVRLGNGEVHALLLNL